MTSSGLELLTARTPRAGTRSSCVACLPRRATRRRPRWACDRWLSRAQLRWRARSRWRTFPLTGRSCGERFTYRSLVVYRPNGHGLSSEDRTTRRSSRIRSQGEHRELGLDRDSTGTRPGLDLTPGPAVGYDSFAVGYGRAGSSVAEHGTFNPLVEGSNPSRLTSHFSSGDSNDAPITACSSCGRTRIGCCR